MAHTPGSWTVGGDEVNVEDEDGDFVATTLKYDEAVGTQQDYDNAKLIAAAPELLAACHLALDYFNETRNGREWRDNGGEEPGVLRDAINKAEGKVK